jgi:hypothetical protein
LMKIPLLTPDLEVRRAPVFVAPARLVDDATVLGALPAEASATGRTLVTDVELRTPLWPVVRVGALVVGVAAREGFVALGAAGGQPIQEVGASGVVVANISATRVVALDRAALVETEGVLRLRAVARPAGMAAVSGGHSNNNRLERQWGGGTKGK